MRVAESTYIQVLFCCLSACIFRSVFEFCFLCGNRAEQERAQQNLLTQNLNKSLPTIHKRKPYAKTYQPSRRGRH
ncbi:hypothetical protein FHS90_003155 [Rufibacter quisquiliarum]|uniref:Uncharacterized protein n=1 Tax=Rufibacter quisquiliarum TaxID=1549639 RepID=A0A839GU76_9BACT|nr:hypothetical protein [Rufibacter quisquiliarum]